MTTQIMASTISYTPQPYFGAGAASVTGLSDVGSIENADGILDPNLSNYTTIIPTVSATQFQFGVDFNTQGRFLFGDMNFTVALIGCVMLTYEDDGGGSPDYDTEYCEPLHVQTSSEVGTDTSNKDTYAYNSQNDIRTFERVELPGIITGGTTNLVFGAGTLGTGGSSIDPVTTTFKFYRGVLAASRPHAILKIGHMFVGIDVPVQLDPRTFTWGMSIDNERFRSRGNGMISSDGAVLRRSSFDAIKMNYSNVGGFEVADDASYVLAPNLFDLVKVNNSYPVLFNPYPYAYASPFGGVANTLLSRQNFFSIYGFLEGDAAVSVGDYRNGLETDYRASFRIEETR